MVEGPDFTGVVGRAKGPDPVRVGPFGDHWTPEKGKRAEVRIRYTPNPAEPDASDAEPSVFRTTSGEKSEF